MAENQIPATSLAGLEKFAGTVFDGSQGKYTLDEYAYFDDTSLFSTAVFTPAAGIIAAGTEQNLFNTPIGAIGQGFAAATTVADTNLERGAQGGKFPANLAYVALAGGFQVYMGNPAGNAGLLLPVDNTIALHQIVSNIVWSWNVGGDASPRLRYEPIKLWPCGQGVYGTGAAMGVNVGATVETPAAGARPVDIGLANGGPTATMRKFAFPLFFPPNVAVDCRLTCARGLDFAAIAGIPAGAGFAQGTLGAAGDVRIAFHLRGYKLSRIV